MRRGLDIADVEQRTKIRAKYLRALELEEWDQLPGPTFVRTFLRTYAEVVGLDAQLLIEEYRVGHEPEPADLAAPLSGPPAAAGRERRRPPGPPPRTVVAAILVVAFIGFLLVLGLSADEPTGAPEPAAGPTEAERRAERRAQRRERPEPAAPRRVVVRITPSEPTYLCMDAGEGTEIVFEGTLDAARTFRDPQTLRLNLGKRSVEIVANGDPVPIEESPEPYGLEVTRSATEEIVGDSRPCA